MRILALFLFGFLTKVIFNMRFLIIFGLLVLALVFWKDKSTVPPDQIGRVGPAASAPGNNAPSATEKAFGDSITEWL